MVLGYLPTYTYKYLIIYIYIIKKKKRLKNKNNSLKSILCYYVFINNNNYRLVIIKNFAIKFLVIFKN